MVPSGGSFTPPKAKGSEFHYHSDGSNSPYATQMVTADLTLLATDPSAGPAPSGPGAGDTRLLRTSVIRVQLQRLAMRGLNAKEAAKLVGVSPETARLHYNDPEFRRGVLAKVDGAFAGTDAAFIERTKTFAEKLEEQAAESFEALRKMLIPETNGGRELADTHKIKIHTQFLDRHAETAPISRGNFRIDPIELSHAARIAAEMDNPAVVEMPKRLSSGAA